MAEPDPNTPDWRLTGDWWDLCNCAIGCPCNFGSDPTLGYCEGVLTWLNTIERHQRSFQYLCAGCVPSVKFICSQICWSLPMPLSLKFRSVNR